MRDLVLALLDTSSSLDVAGLAARLRSLTIDWARFKYDGPMVEGSDLAGVLSLAADLGARVGAPLCLVQAHGHVLTEVWRPEGRPERDLLAALVTWFRSLPTANDRPLAAVRRGDRFPAGCWLVDLAAWQRGGRPNLAETAAVLPDFPTWFYGCALDLRPAEAAVAPALARLLSPDDGGIGSAQTAFPDPVARQFVATVRRLVTDLPRGVFIWNIESYADIDPPPAEFRGPLASVYTVAAGLKPNRLLETHGFDATTRVVYCDYSAPGLAFRRCLLDDWDGRDYPSFVRRLFARLPTDQAYYCLWEGQTPETVDWATMAARWQSEVDAWGGASVLAHHWRRYRRLPHHFVEVNLLGDRSPLLTSLADEPAAAIWWSNAFFSVVSNWRLPASARRQVYRAFLRELAERAPRLWLYGASSDNLAVNAVQAADYERWFREGGGDELMPASRRRTALLF